MEEIVQFHSLQLEWGCITNLANRIIEVESRIEGGWEELADMIATAMTEEGVQKNPVVVFFDLYSFLFRLYYRVKANPTKKPFNQCSKHEDEFWITNYDYNMYKWARAQGFTEGVDNLVIKIPMAKLTTKQVTAFTRRCGKEKNGN